MVYSSTHMYRHHSQQLISWKNAEKRKPLIIRGARQVGKTFSLKKFGREHFPAFHYLDFEEDPGLCDIFEPDLRPERIISDLRFRLNTNINPSTDLIVFDEIQRCGRALTSLKYFCEEMPQLALCAAGSLLGVALTPDSFPVGKVSFLDFYPMSFSEFVFALDEQMLGRLLCEHNPRDEYPEPAHQRLWQLWKEYLVVGGLPAAVAVFAAHHGNLFEAVGKVRTVQRDLVTAYLADIAKHSGKLNALHIERVWRSVPAQLARGQDGNAPKFKFRGVVPGIRGYDRLAGPIDWLEAAGLLLRTSIVETPCIPLSAFAGENRFKLYLFDIGILGALGGIDPRVFLEYDFGSYKGYVAENFVAQELTASGAVSLYCWTGRTSEVEFLFQRGSAVIPLEVKSGRSTRSKSLDVFEDRYHPAESFVLSARNAHRRGSRLYMPLYAAESLLAP